MDRAERVKRLQEARKRHSHEKPLPLQPVFPALRYGPTAVSGASQQTIASQYTLGENILWLGWKCLDLILEANSLPNKEKYSKILELSVSFDKLKIRIRMAQELNLISEGQFAHIQTYYIKEMGEMVGGWLKWAQSQ